ncbi:hypothetical protein PtA15_10A621 [Puccinia triticina]|uniref:Uncharacterized protein n=1 Tax=Puccinia triticina TaxID=208348 RepID=A0ABY7CXM4_9BASI|nr:uncharacterized protein PtA15_10A621 [Puccinia triticina]WAQ89197.1 hypothetical protein PtA15_10A621 [Puccinia triticina]
MDNMSSPVVVSLPWHLLAMYRMPKMKVPEADLSSLICSGEDANNAPALARASFGIAVKCATDAACGDADIVLWNARGHPHFQAPSCPQQSHSRNKLQGTPSRAASINESLYFNRASFIPREARSSEAVSMPMTKNSKVYSSSGAAGGIEQ